jgi:two-component system LytT family response regulator
MKIRVVIVDDERKAIAILRSKLERYCPQLEIVGETQSPQEGIKLIAELEPDLVFLDIAMPEMNGFEMLKAIENPNFEIIFITAFDEYAIEAIRHCAIGYIVKPVDKEDLIKTIHNAIVNIESKQALEKNKQLIANLGAQTFQKKKIVIPTQKGLEFVPIPSIIRCEGIDGYTKIYLTGGVTKLSSNSIGHFVRMLDNELFYQVHKSHLINLDHIISYLNEGYVFLSEKNQAPVSRNKRIAFLNTLKGNKSL